jgi:hypothetical protein
MRDDGPGRLGVFLRHDPEDFSLRRRAAPHCAGQRCGPRCRMPWRPTLPMPPMTWPG